MKTEAELRAMVAKWDRYFRDHPEIGADIEGELKHDLLSMVCAYQHYKNLYMRSVSGAGSDEGSKQGS